MDRSLISKLARPSAFSRRECLRSSLAAGAALMLADRRSGAAPRDEAPQVVIIGAGFGGLSCAYQLQRTGALVTVLEARQRLGGRVHSLYSLLPGKKVEAGAEWIGLNHPTWLAYAKQFGLSLNELPEGEEEESPILLNGRRLIDKEVAQLWTSLDQVLQSMNGDARTINRQQPWLSANAKQLDGQSLAQASQGWPGSPLAKQAAMAKIANGMNCLPDRFSYLAIWNQLAFLSRGSRRLTEITLYQLVTGGVLELNYNKETLSIAESLTQKLSELDNLVVYRVWQKLRLEACYGWLKGDVKNSLISQDTMKSFISCSLAVDSQVINLKAIIAVIFIGLLGLIVLLNLFSIITR